MTAMTVLGSHSLGSAFSTVLTMATLVPLLLIVAPQPIRTDKRVIVGLIALAAVAIGVPVYAVVCNVCSVCNGDWWWLFAECWFI